jgi:two-component system, LytTR family, response regulator
MSKEKKYRTLIVDDEKYARKDLREQLSSFTCIDVIGEAKNIETAIEHVERLKPDLIFLDIQFPGETGFDLFEKTSIIAKVIFVTAYDEYAIRAFEVNACDYLLKPVNPVRLAMTIKRLSENPEPDVVASNVFRNEDSIYIQLNYKYYFIRIDSIVKITATDHYTEITTSKGIKGLSNKHLFEWAECLPKSSFIQVHRSSIVNINFVEKISRGSCYSHQIKMKSIETLIPISRKYLGLIKEKFPVKI